MELWLDMEGRACMIGGVQYRHVREHSMAFGVDLVVAARTPLICIASFLVLCTHWA